MVLPNGIFMGLQRVLLSVLTLTVFLWGATPRADTANMYLTLTILTPPQCTIAGGTNMSVGFGEVHETLIDGNSYKRMPIDYNLSCASVARNALKMTLSWNSITLNGGSAIQTNRSNLGIAIYRDTTRLSNNTTLNFTYDVNHPNLYAVPIKPTGMMLTDGGPFIGNMTMIIDYQ